MKKSYSLLLILLVLGVAIASCEKDDYTGYSTLEATDAKGTLSWSAAAPPASMVEQDSVFNFTITLDKPQVADIHIVIKQTGGNATKDSDFTLTDEIIIPAYQTTGSGAFKVIRDKKFEETESVTFRIGDISLSNLEFTPQTFTVELTNYIYPYLDLTFDWGGTAIYNYDTLDWNGNTYYDSDTVSLCDEVDIDILVFDVDNNDLGIYGAATGACPEHLTLEGLADGDYYLWANLYDSTIAPTDGTIVSMPITVTTTQPGLFEGVVYNQLPASVITSSDPTDGSTLKPVAKVTVSGGTNYTITPL